MTEQAQESTAPQTSAPQESQASNDFAVPEAYAEKGWAKTIGSYDDLWKTFDNTQSLIGKRSTPDNDASQEQWDDYYNSMRPKDANGYELSEVEGFSENFDLETAQDQAKQLAHKIGLTPKQANDLWMNYADLEKQASAGRQEQHQAQEAELDKQFDELGGSLFGDKLDDVSTRAQSYLKESLPEGLKDVAESLSGNPKALLAMVALADKNMNDSAEIKRQYGAEDTLASGSQAGGQSIDEINGQLNAAKQRYSETPPFSQERKNIDGEIQALRAKLKSVVK